MERILLLLLWVKTMIHRFDLIQPHPNDEYNNNILNLNILGVIEILLYIPFLLFQKSEEVIAIIGS
jgi:hypothetical protein